MAKILILDDREDYLRSLAQALREDFEVVAATSLEEATQRVDRTIDLALVDIRLSEDDASNRDGLNFLEWVRLNRPNIPVIMMSAYREFDLAVESLNLGASYFLRKPINLVELKALLRLFSEKRELERQLKSLKRQT